MHHEAQRWFSEDLKVQKLALRQTERKWRRNYSPDKKDIYLAQLKEYKKSIQHTKATYFSSKILNSTNK